MRSSLYSFGTIFNMKNISPFLRYLNENLKMDATVLKKYIKSNPSSYVTSKRVLFSAKHGHLFDENPECDKIVYNFNYIPVDQWYKPIQCPNDIIWPCNFKPGYKKVSPHEDIQESVEQSDSQRDQNEISENQNKKQLDLVKKEHPMHYHDHQKVKHMLNKRSRGAKHEITEEERLFLNFLDTHR